MMKLKDTLPQSPLLVQVTDKSGTRHQNFVAVNLQLGENNDHVLHVHYSEFLSAQQPILKNRIKKFLDEIVTYADPSRKTMASDAQKQEIANDLFSRLIGHLQSNKDLAIVRNQETGEISNITPKPVLSALEAGYRRALPKIAKSCGVLFDTETLRTPVIVITDNNDISSLVPKSWPEKVASGFAYKAAGVRTTPDCDSILLSHGCKGLYEIFCKNVKDHPDLSHNIIPLLAHELTHHLGLDEMAKGEIPLLPFLKTDREFTKQFYHQLARAMASLQGSAENSAVIATLKELGLLGEKLPLLRFAMREHPPGAGVNIGRSITLENLQTSTGKLQGPDRRYLKELMQEVEQAVQFAYDNASIPIITAGELARTGQDINDEMLPTVIMAQSELGADATRILFPNTYPRLTEVMQKHGIDITHSMSLALPTPAIQKK
jgi:hypothetical protein